ncbi:hypothetical protein CEXT_317771 [Caerostris extrusa]|uniref:Uncharacterized protein n=1 Tax=Caerostris extrusa TaxID=172846 RepID=A0AAV4MYN7_CAEEX|nr:hypothetical protein CEXT_317771 [Caerostris extrusa]
MVKPSFVPCNDAIDEVLAVRMVTLKKCVTAHHSCVALCSSDNASGTQRAHTLEYHSTSETICYTLPKLSPSSDEISRRVTVDHFE